jgi:hypothetical protein
MAENCPLSTTGEGATHSQPGTQLAFCSTPGVEMLKTHKNRELNIGRMAHEEQGRAV